MHRATRVGRARDPPRPVPWCGLAGDERPACSARRRIEVVQGARSSPRAGRVAFGHAISTEPCERNFACRLPRGTRPMRSTLGCRPYRPRWHNLLLKLPPTMPPTPCPPSTIGFSLPMPRTVRAACRASPLPNASEWRPASSHLVHEVESRCTGRAFDVPRRAASVRGRRVRRFARISERAAPAHRNNARIADDWPVGVFRSRGYSRTLGRSPHMYMLLLCSCACRERLLRGEVRSSGWSP